MVTFLRMPMPSPLAHKQRCITHTDRSTRQLVARDRAALEPAPRGTRRRQEACRVSTSYASIQRTALNVPHTSTLYLMGNLYYSRLVPARRVAARPGAGSGGLVCRGSPGPPASS